MIDNDQEILKLVAITSRTEQKVDDLCARIDKAIPFLVEEDKALGDRVSAVEKRQWYWSGAFAAIGAVIGWVAHLFKAPIGH